MKSAGYGISAAIFFLPQVILSSDAMIAGITLCEEKMGHTIDHDHDRLPQDRHPTLRDEP